MKKQVQKIKENKGFSMIELIIVVAIMAILVGIIGAALIPYMEKSRASKDKSALDSLYSAFSSAIAESEDPVTKIMDSSRTYGLSTDGEKAVEALLDGTISDLLGKIKSKQFKPSGGNPTIKFFYNNSSPVVYGVYMEGNGDYTGVQIDSTGAEHKVGVKGDNDKTAEGNNLGTTGTTSTAP